MARVDQSQYLNQLLSDYCVNTEAILGPSRALGGDVIFEILELIAKTLDSQGAFLLSLAGDNRSLQIRACYTSVPGLERLKGVKCFDKLRRWLESDRELWSLDDTSAIPELYNVHIKSILAMKISVNVGQREGKALLMVCNRDSYAFEEYERRYTTYDALLCEVTEGPLRLYVAGQYRLLKQRYDDAKQRYTEARSSSALMLVGDTAKDLLALYRQYLVTPPGTIVQDYIDAHVTLFNSKGIDASRLREVLEECEDGYLASIRKSEPEGAALVCYALARGYFALGVQNNEDWVKGGKLIASIEGTQGASNFQ